MKISNNNLKKYEERMKQVENNIWNLVNNLEYYNKIRGIMFEYSLGLKLSKRQTLRLYEFIYNITPKIYTKDKIDEEYINVKTMLEEEVGE